MVSHKLNQSSSGIGAELANLNGLEKAACTVLLTWIKDVWPVFWFNSWEFHWKYHITRNWNIGIIARRWQLDGNFFQSSVPCSVFVYFIMKSLESLVPNELRPLKSSINGRTEQQWGLKFPQIRVLLWALLQCRSSYLRTPIDKSMYGGVWQF